MLCRRRQILPDRHDRDPRAPQVLQRLNDLLVALPQTEHDPGFHGDSVADLMREAQHFQRFAVSRACADLPRQPLNRLDVVVENRRPGGEYGGNRPAVAVEIGSQHLDSRPRQPPVQRVDDRGETVRSTVRQIVPGHAGHDHIVQMKSRGGFREPFGLVLLRRSRVRRMVDRAETAVARAAAPHDEKRRRTGTETLPEIRAERPGTNRVEPQIAQNPGDLLAGASCSDPDFQPLRQPGALRLALPSHDLLLPAVGNHHRHVRPPESETV